MSKHREQGGYALVFVLILLAVGALLIVPSLDYVSTGLHSQRLNEYRLHHQDDSDAALLDAIWEIINGDVLVQVNETGEYCYDVELGLARWDVTIEIPSFGATSDWQTVRQNNECKIEVVPNWIGADLQDNETFYYILRLDMVQWDLTEFSFSLPLGLAYSNLSAMHWGPESQSAIARDAEINLYAEPHQYWRLKDPAGWADMINGTIVEVDEMPVPRVPDTWYLLKEWQEDGRQKLTWLPDFGATGNDTFFLVFQVTGTLSFGIHSITPVFGDGVDVISLEATAAVAAATYNVTIEAGGQTAIAVVGVTEDGLELVSYERVT
ncbi:hypothetical protein ACFLXE_04085 [Chloroflexota bacterium]